MQTSIATRLVPALACVLAAVLCSAAAPAQAERIKDLAQVAGVRGNPLVGYGLVVGLDGSGDRTSQTPFTVQSLKTMLDQLGVTIPPGVNPQLKNVAAVAIQAELPTHGRTLLVGTANCSLDNIAFYQKCGFRMDHVRRDYFWYHRTPVVEHGIPVRDMLVFRYDLVESPVRVGQASTRGRRGGR